jgi:hypothetical protein
MASITDRVASRQLELVGLRLKAAATGGVKLALTREIKEAAKPLIEDVKQAAESELPKAGGLNEWVAGGKFSSSVRYTGIQIGVRIVATARKSSRGGTSQFGTDRGTFRHPVFGHTDRWVTQQLATPGWFTKTLEKKAPETTTPRVLAALTEVQVALMRPL